MVRRCCVVIVHNDFLVFLIAVFSCTLCLIVVDTLVVATFYCGLSSLMSCSCNMAK